LVGEKVRGVSFLQRNQWVLVEERRASSLSPWNSYVQDSYLDGVNNVHKEGGGISSSSIELKVLPGNFGF
jgi:hypothetical protein